MVIVQDGRFISDRLYQVLDLFYGSGYINSRLFFFLNSKSLPLSIYKYPFQSQKPNEKKKKKKKHNKSLFFF